jgi:hypothetical protein
VNKENTFHSSGIYHLTCGDSGKRYVYIGQTGGFETRYKESLHSFRSNNTNSKFAQHLLENGQVLGKMDEIYLKKKAAHTYITEKFFYIYIKRLKRGIK